MGDGAAQLLDRVLPDVPYRQIVVSLPFEVRGLLAFRPPVLTAAIRLVDDTVTSWQRDRSGGKVGALWVLQRAGGSLNLNPHLHLLLADGAWHEQPEGTLEFQKTPAPTLSEVAALAERIADRLTTMLRRRGFVVRDGDEPPKAAAPDALGRCIQIALGLGHREREGPALKVAAGEPSLPTFREEPLCAVARGVNVHAGAKVPAGDRAALERLVRYLLRPPLSLQRLSLREDGAVVYRLQRPDGRGRTVLVMSPLELLSRLAAILPAPRFALRRLLGVLAAGSPDRGKLVPAKAPRKNGHAGEHLAEPASAAAPAAKVPTRVPWAELLRRVWDLDSLRCEHGASRGQAARRACGGRMQPVATIQDPVEAEHAASRGQAARRGYLRHMGQFTPIPSAARSRAPPAAA